MLVHSLWPRSGPTTSSGSPNACALTLPTPFVWSATQKLTTNNFIPNTEVTLFSK